MNEVVKYEFQGQQVRSLLIEDVTYFVGKDVAIILGYSNHRKALNDHVDIDDKTNGVTIRDSMGREQTPTVINESGLYSLILSSKLPKAKEFKRWVTSEVLPTIRKTGSYGKHDNLEKILNNMIDLSNGLIQLTKSVSEMCIAVTERTDGVSKTQPLQNNRSEIIDFDYQKCKLDFFPEEIKFVVNSMMEEMIKKEALNFSLIAKTCIANGYNITSPSVKTYYEKHFKKE